MLPRYKAEIPPSCWTIFRHDVRIDSSEGVVVVVTMICRRIRIKSNGAVTMRLHNPAVPPATQWCQKGYDVVVVSSFSCRGDDDDDNGGGWCDSLVRVLLLLLAVLVVRLIVVAGGWVVTAVTMIQSSSSRVLLLV